MMKLEIARQANLLDEAYLLLYQWINNSDLETFKEKYADNYLANMDNYYRRTDIILEMYHYVIDNIKADKERIEYYFKERNPQLSTYAALALLLDFRDTSAELPTYQERLGRIASKNRIKEFARVINYEEDTNIKEEEICTIEDLISLIENSSYDTASKWEALKIFNNQEACYNEVSKILSEASDLLEKKYSSQITGLSQEFYEYWKDYQENNDIIDTLHDKLKISWEKSEKGAVLLPTIFLPFTVSIAVDDVVNSSRDVIRIGVILDKRFEISGSKIKKEDVVEFGKLLSDKSKVDILEYVSKKPCYGKEIANELNLSTATISYHVNALLKAGFLQAEVISNKVYYSINRERISNHLEDVKGFFGNIGIMQ